jgi:alkylated DNA repair dioxygenase AlkB
MDARAPSGFRYLPDFVAAREEAALLEVVRALTFDEVAMRGQVARRRVAHFGWRYGYESWRIEPGPPLPEALHPLRARAAALGTDDARETRAIELAPRSAYVLDGEVRRAWQHTIPPAKSERYSITFRTMRARASSPRTGPRSS